MGNCGTKPKTSDGDDAPPPVEAQAAAGAAEGERRDDEEVAAPQGTSQTLVAPQTEVRKNDLSFLNHFGLFCNNWPMVCTILRRSLGGVIAFI
jgi:hypothetical protein